ncbi:MAG: hypothetical protein V4580_02685 [Bacteroidota bacterium]
MGIIYSFSIFFFLDEKETKIQSASWRRIPFARQIASQNGGSHRIAKSSRTITNVWSVGGELV